MTGTAALFGVDAGGSRTRVVLERPGTARREWEFPSVNAHSVGAAAGETLRALLRTLCDEVGHEPCTGWIASASVDPDQPGPELSRIAEAARDAGFAARLIVSNDIVPLLWGSPGLDGEGVAVVCGTGSGFFGADRHGGSFRAGGCEYLGSDEGGAADIGRRGLRAAVRAGDGRGALTTLTGLFTEATGLPLPQLARAIAAEPHPKQRLADLAPMVCAAWTAGDEVCTRLVHQAARELVTGVSAVRRRLHLPHRYTAVTVGGLFSGCRPFHALTEELLREHEDVGDVVLPDVSADVVLAALKRLPCDGDRLSPPPAIADRNAWLMDTSAAPPQLTPAEATST